MVQVNGTSSTNDGLPNHKTPAAADGGRDGFGPAFTETIVGATGPRAPERLRGLVGNLIRHLHDFCRENQVTTEEWLAALDFVNEAGRMSDAERNEGQLFCGVLGIETLLDRMQDAGATVNKASGNPTSSNLLGPFYRNDSPLLENGSNIVLNDSHDGRRVHMYGQVLDAATQEPIPGVELDVWHSNAEGLYAQQDPSQPYLNLRGKFLTDEKGKYEFYCGIPAAYSIPDDGPAGKLLRLLDRHPMRPAHLHFIVRANKYETITTELFDRNSSYLRDDSMYAVKEDLIVDFVPIRENDKAEFELKFDFQMRQQLPASL